MLTKRNLGKKETHRVQSFRDSNYYSKVLSNALEMNSAEKPMLIIHVEESLKEDYKRIDPEIAKIQEREAVRRFNDYLNGEEPTVSFEDSLQRLKS